MCSILYAHFVSYVYGQAGVHIILQYTDILHNVTQLLHSECNTGVGYFPKQIFLYYELLVWVILKFYLQPFMGPISNSKS